MQIGDINVERSNESIYTNFSQPQIDIYDANFNNKILEKFEELDRTTKP